MVSTIDKTSCITCGKGKIAYKCEGCSQCFCIIHLPEHHQTFSKQLNELDEKYRLFQENLDELTKNPEKHCLIEQVNQWENDSIKKIQQTAEEARQLLIKYTSQNIKHMELKLLKLTNELEEIRIENDFNEIDLNKFKEQLNQLEDQLNKPSNILTQQDSSSFINKISVLIIDDKPCLNTKTTTKEDKASAESSTSTNNRTSQDDNKPFIFGNSNGSSSTSIFGNPTSNGPVFGSAPSFKPANNTGSGFYFPAFGNTSTTQFSTGFQFSIPNEASASKTTTTTSTTSTPFSFGISTNAPLFGNAPKFSFGDLAKQASSNDKPTTNGTEQRVFAGQGSLVFGTGSVNKTTTENNDEKDNEDDSYETNVLFKPIVQLAPVEVRTSEEDENILFCERAKLYRFDSNSNQMKERGIGQMKVLQHKTTNRCRILMRREQVLKLCANHQITSQMELKPHQGTENAYIWSAMDFADGEAKHEILCARFKTNEQAKRFAKIFNEAREMNSKRSGALPSAGTSSLIVENQTKSNTCDDDVISIGEVKPSAEQIDRTKKLHLPSTFYLYENKQPCKGCPGCEEDTPSTQNIENKSTTIKKS